ncbi:hypothetical protein C2S51_032752 [Perilla frutescens var. frutescens]|nr:hypothetical protein C2S51_032752 [Perilla frutescens var. frutescens]
MEVPIVTETNSMARGSRNSLGLKYVEQSPDIAEPSPVQNHVQQKKAKTVQQKRRAGEEVNERWVHCIGQCCRKKGLGLFVFVQS